MEEPRLFRIYEPWELRVDGYPLAWLDTGDGRGVKDIVRELAGHRCLRCRHPYRVGESGEYDVDGSRDVRKSLTLQMELDETDRRWERRREIDAVGGPEPVGVNWSDCDPQCRHGGPMRAMTTEGWSPFNPTPEACGSAVAALRSDYPGLRPPQAAWRILTVHHLNGRKYDLRWHNLVSLCQRCHLTIQRKVTMNQVWPFEHSDWFREYAAGYYAQSYLGEELSRAEVIVRLGELLALERLA